MRTRPAHLHQDSPADATTWDYRAGRGAMQVTASEVEGLPRIRDVYYHDPAAPPATVVVPSVFVAVHDQDDRLLMVQRCDSGDWELPGGRVDVGESAVAAAQREVAEETGVVVHVTGLIGLYTDPGFIVRVRVGRGAPAVRRAVPGRPRVRSAASGSAG